MATQTPPKPTLTTNVIVKPKMVTASPKPSVVATPKPVAVAPKPTIPIVATTPKPTPIVVAPPKQAPIVVATTPKPNVGEVAITPPIIGIGTTTPPTPTTTPKVALPSFPNYANMPCVAIKTQIQILQNQLATSKFTQEVREAYQNALARANSAYNTKGCAVSLPTPKVDIPTKPTEPVQLPTPTSGIEIKPTTNDVIPPDTKPTTTSVKDAIESGGTKIPNEEQPTPTPPSGGGMGGGGGATPEEAPQEEAPKEEAPKEEAKTPTPQPTPSKTNWVVVALVIGVGLYFLTSKK
jgi:hypothetical protein